MRCSRAQLKSCAAGVTLRYQGLPVHLLSRWQKVVNVMRRRSCLEMEVQATQAAAATAPTSPLDGFEATTRVTRNDQACRIPIVYRQASALLLSLSVLTALHPADRCVGQLCTYHRCCSPSVVLMVTCCSVAAKSKRCS